MAGVNKVFVIGNVGKDPESRSLQNGGKVVSFSVAVSETWKDKSTGERQERTQWIPIVIFNENLATIAEKYVKKGSKIHVEGQFETRKWTDKDGREKYTTEVVLRPYRGELTLLDGKSDDAPKSTYRDAQTPTGGTPRSAKPAQSFDDLSDEIPFSPRLELA